jgi:hypothetical protein
MLRPLLGGALVALACSCSDAAPPPPPPAPAPAPSTRAPDELAPGEVGEGPFAAFGLPIPADLTIDTITPTLISARGQAPLEEITNYVRARVDAEQVVTGPAKTVFDGVKVKAPRPGGSPPDRVLRYEVESADGFTTLTARTDVRAKVPEGLTEAERWARSGMRPDGKPLDPKKFE